MIQCIGLLMITVDSTSVTVSLPSIKGDLHFAETSLVWVVNAYIVPYAGCLLICGRLGDCYGYRRIFLIGIALFTLASLCCGLANSEVVLLAARAAQGVTGAAISAVVLSMILSEFEQTAERAKALSIVSSICAGGGSLGVLIGGFLTGQLNWHWIFLVNVPTGVAVCILWRLLPHPESSLDGSFRPSTIDVWSAVTFTGTAILVAYDLLQAPTGRWYSTSTALPLLGTIILSILFVLNESRTQHPIIPRALIQDRNISLAVISGMFWSASMYIYTFSFPLYLGGILHYNPLEIGLTFLPSNIVQALFLALSGSIAMRYGVKRSFVFGTTSIAIGLLLLIRAPIDARFAIDILPGTLLFGFGCGIANSPWILGASSGNSEQNHHGAVSGILYSALIIGGALGLSSVTGFVSAYTNQVHQTNAPNALNEGYHLMLALAAGCGGAAALVGALSLKSRPKLS